MLFLSKQIAMRRLSNFGMIFMEKLNSIAEQLSYRHEDFLEYCRESGKVFVEELSGEDFIAYRSKYAVSNESIAQLKNLLAFRTKTLSNFED